MARLSVFISYRRNDSRYLVREIAAGLRERFGKDNVFLDRDTIRIGEEFPSRIDEAIKKSDVMLVVIGENFLPALTSGSESWIRQELLSARKHKRLVFPVLHPGRVMPTKAELPDDVEWLSDLNAFALGDEEHLETDIERLSSDLAKQFNQSLRRTRRRRRRNRAPLAAGAVASLAVALGTVALIRSGSDPAPIIEVQSPSVTSPGNIVDCSDFDSYDDAKRWFDKYYDQFGDVAELDVDGDLEPCESLRTVAATDTAEVSSPGSISAAEPPSTDLESPGNIVDCSDFDSYDDAKQWFDKYYDDFGDVAELDANGDLEPCESLRVDEADSETPADDKVDGSTNQLLDEQSSAPDNPGNSVNCDDFDSYSEAKEWFDTYFPYFGDVAYLDSNGDGRPCDTFFVSAHDMFADAKRINATGSGTTTAENSNASIESGEPNHTSGSYRSIWFALTTPGTGQLEIDTSGSTFDTTLTVYQGSTLRTLNRITGNDDYYGSRSRVAISTTNQTYMVAVDGYAGRTGNIQLNWTYASETEARGTTATTTAARIATQTTATPRATTTTAPRSTTTTSTTTTTVAPRSAHDMFTDAKRINATGSGTTTAENSNASTESGEPNHTSGSYRSIWFALTTPGTGQLEIDTSGSTFDTTLTVYQGSTLRTLNRITGNDDYYGSLSRVAISTTNQTYMVAVDGYAGRTGNIQLNWTYTPTTTTTTTTTTSTTTTTVAPDPAPKITADSLSTNLLRSNSGANYTYWTVTIYDPSGQLPVQIGGRLCPPGSLTPLTAGCTGANMGGSGSGYSRTYTGLFIFGQPITTGDWVPFAFWPLGQASEHTLTGNSRLLVTP